MSFNDGYNLTIVGKIEDMLKEIAAITGEEPERIVESLILRYHKEVKAKNEPVVREDDYPHLKVGKIANIHLRKQLETREVSDKLLGQLQTEEYSKNNFDLQYPLLVKRGTVFESLRYYKKPLLINGDEYYMCSQWYETSANDDRSYLVYWLKNFPEGDR